MKDVNSLRICFVAGTLERGGAERQLLYMLQSLVRLGVTCRVLSLTKDEPYEVCIRELGVPVTWVGESQSRLRRLWRIVWELRNWTPDIIQSGHSFTNLYVALAARLLGCQDIGAIRSNGITEIQSLGHLGGLNVRLPSSLIANSSQAIAITKKQAARESSSYLLENAIDCELFTPRAERRYSPERDDPVELLAVGNLREPKRHDLFLQVATAVKQQYPGIRARVVGSGPLRDKLEKLATQLGIADVVEFAGSQSDMVSIYQEADILVHCSDYEGMPNVVMEAMACGLPVVSTRVGAVPDLIEHSVTGYMTEARDVNALVRYVLELVQSPALRQQMGQAARARVVSEYSLNSLGPKMATIYQSILMDNFHQRRRRYSFWSRL